MEELSLTETETRYYSDLFVCCDVDKTGKIPVLKATELFRSANLSNVAIRQITSISGIPQKALHISRTEFYSCLKLIAAYQASIPLRPEIITPSIINLPLPRFSWKESPPIPTRNISATTAAATTSTIALGSTDTINNITGTNSSTNNYMVSSITSISSGSGTSGLNSDINGLIINEEKRKNSLGGNPITKETINRQWRETNSPDLIEIVRVVSDAAVAQETANSDLHSTDSEVEHNDSTSGRVNRRHRGGSPEAWSTNSDSPTPTNSVAERPWAKDTMWQGLLGDEHRQLLGTEEESSDRHSSDDDNETDIETIYQITTEQREYYHKQFKAVQPDPNGLLSGHVARVFFEKSRIPVEELRHIWQLCDVTRDGALSLAEFTAAMHLVVLRRNNIPLPSVLPTCLHPTILCGSSNDSSRNSSSNKHPTEPPEADLLHLDDDDGNDEIDDNDDENTSIVAVDGSGSGSSTITGGTTSSSLILNKTPNDIVTTTSGPNGKEFKPIISRPDKNSTKLNTLSNNSQSTGNKQLDKTLTASPPPVHTKNRSISNTPPAEPTTPPSLRSKEISKDWTNQSKEWTKFTESPTSNVSSPGPKPVNFDMQRTAQAVVSDPQILHPVPLRVTPVGTEVIDDESSRLSRKSENLVYDISSGVLRENESSPKQQSQQQHRDSLQNSDLRAIQRPQAKKLPTKNIGAIPPPPQRESSIGGIDSIDILPTTINTNTNNNGGGGTSVINNISLLSKKDPPPLPPPRPHRHARSSSLDLNKLKMSGNPSQPEMTTQASLDVQTDSTNIAFADFTQFPESNKMATTDQLPSSIHTLVSNDSSYSTTNSNNTIPPRPTISTLQTNHRASAFEVYRKPNTPRNSQSPDSQLQFQPLPPLPPTLSSSQNPVPSVPLTGGSANVIASTITCLSTSLVPSTNSSSSSTSINASSGLEYDKRVNAISETLRHISLKNDKNITDVLRHLREQNVLLLRLCNDLSDELLTVQQRKEEIRCKLESQRDGSVAGGSITTVTGGGAGSGSISSNVTGGSTGSGTMHSNV